MKISSRLLLCLTALSLSACSTLQSDKVDYKSLSKAPTTSLQVPPDLTQLSRDTRYSAPGSTVTASGFQVVQANPAASTAASSIGDVRIERAGAQRWLVVDRSADKLWEPIKEFWIENGFVLSLEQANLGIMETDWAENRAKIPQDLIRRTLGRVLDALYSTGERDKFRTRLERNNSSTEIYVSHRGLSEEYKDAQKSQTIWQPRQPDPELEAEFLRRMMVKLGVSQERAQSLVAASTPKLGAKIATIEGLPVVQLEEGFDRAWRRVGLSLDRSGFTVEDRDRSQGTYFVRYVEPVSNKEEAGFFSKLFGGSPKPNAPQKYRILVKGQNDLTTVSVLNVNGMPENSENASRIVKVLADDMK